MTQKTYANLLIGIIIFGVIVGTVALTMSIAKAEGEEESLRQHLKDECAKLNPQFRKWYSPKRGFYRSVAGEAWALRGDGVALFFSGKEKEVWFSCDELTEVAQ